MITPKKLHLTAAGKTAQFYWGRGIAYISSMTESNKPRTKAAGCGMEAA